MNRVEQLNSVARFSIINILLIKVLKLKKTNVEINNKIKEDSTVVRFLINYKVNLKSLKKTR